MDNNKWFCVITQAFRLTALCDAKDTVQNLLLCCKCLPLFMNSLEIKACLQKYYEKVAESIVLGKEEVKKFLKNFSSCSLQINAASHAQTLESIAGSRHNQPC